jgi:hypothetical protein
MLGKIRKCIVLVCGLLALAGFLDGFGSSTGDKKDSKAHLKGDYEQKK